MKYIFLDTETTDLEPGQICQLSYIIENGNERLAKNFFFEVDFICDEARAVHGFTVEKLKELSSGMKFKQIKFELLYDFDEALVVGHNVGFDMSFMDHEMNNISLRNKEFCTMFHFTDIMQLQSHNHRGYKWPT